MRCSLPPRATPSSVAAIHCRGVLGFARANQLRSGSPILPRLLSVLPPPIPQTLESALAPDLPALSDAIASRLAHLQLRLSVVLAPRLPSHSACLDARRMPLPAF